MATAASPMISRQNRCEFNTSLIDKIRQCQNNLKLIWFDPNIKTKEIKNQQEQKLKILNDHVNVFSDSQECVTFLKSLENDKIFLITCGAKASEVLPQAVNMRQVESIFIYCIQVDKYADLVNQFDKIVGVYNDFNVLSKAIEDEFEFFNKRIETFSCFDKEEQSTKDLSKESATFLWHQLFSYIMAGLPRNKKAKDQMIQLCKEYYCRNIEENKNIEKFELEYRSEDAIKWYSKKSFMYKIVNKVLRSENFEFIHAFRFFIGDLSENLRQEHEKMFASGEKTLVLYRGAILNKEEFDRLKKIKGKLISTNGYLSTSRKESQAREYANKSTKRKDVVRVLYHIEIDLEKIDRTIVFADIQNLSESPHEAEVLFDINACFELGSFEEDKEFQIIKMKLSNEGQNIAKTFLESTKKEIEGTGDSIVVGRLLCDLGEYDESLAHFEQLLNKANDEDRVWIEFHIGRILDLKGQSAEAEKYYKRARNLIEKIGSKHFKEASHMLSSMGNNYTQRGKDDEALKCHQTELQLRQKYNPSDLTDIAKNLNTIGKILTRQDKDNEALGYYEQASTLFEKCQKSNQADAVDTLNNIGTSHEKQKNQKKALEYFQRALSITTYLSPTDETVRKTKDAILRLNATK